MDKQHSSSVKSLKWSNKGLLGVLRAAATDRVEASKTDAALDAELAELLRTWRNRLPAVETTAEPLYMPVPAQRRANAIQERA
jgi:anti-sigma-K factor RskA